jgi:serine/threonine protein kinase
LGRLLVARHVRQNDARLNRRVALKVLRHDHAAGPVWLERFDREARAISALNHPQICTLYIGRQDGIHFLVMEHCDSETLAHALATAHRQGIVHRLEQFRHRRM